MRRQPFETVIAGEPSLLRLVEEVVVDAHRRWHSQGAAWSEPVAYRWLHYEDPDPIARLDEGLAKLRGLGVVPDPALVARARDAAQKLPGGEMIFGRRPRP